MKRSSSQLDVKQQKKRKTINADPLTNHTHETTTTGLHTSHSVDAFDFPRGRGPSRPAVDSNSTTVTNAKHSADLTEKNSTVPKSTLLRKKRDKPSVSDNAKDSQLAVNLPRVEHLNYKRVAVGMKMLVRVAAINSLRLTVSLPNQLTGHIPVTNISPTFTSLLSQCDQRSSDVEDDDADISPLTSKMSTSGRLELTDFFQVGQLLPAMVTAIERGSSHRLHSSGGDLSERASERIELSLNPRLVNSDLNSSDLRAGQTLACAVKSREDHGYFLDLGIDGAYGFLSFDDASDVASLPLGCTRLGCISKSTEDNRVFSMTVDRCASLLQQPLQDISNVRCILPGLLVDGEVISSTASGLILRIFQSQIATVDEFNLGLFSKTRPRLHEKISGRVIYDFRRDNELRFALSLSDHIVNLDSSQDLQLRYPLGRILDSVVVTSVQRDWGLVAELPDLTKAFVHISQITDDFVAGLSETSRPFLAGTLHRGRVTGYHAFDNILQLTFRLSVLERKYFTVGDLRIGEIVKTTVKKLTDTAVVVAISPSVSGVVRPLHYADIPLLRPEKRFKVNANVTCRVLSVDVENQRVTLTAKKTMVNSTLPIISCFQDAKIGINTYGTVCKRSRNGAIIEFYSGVKAFVPSSEHSSARQLGEVLNVTLTAVIPQGSRIVATTESHSSSLERITEADARTVLASTGYVKAVVDDRVLISLHPSKETALMATQAWAAFTGSSVVHATKSITLSQMMHNLHKMTTINNTLVIVSPKNGTCVPERDIVQGNFLQGRVMSSTQKGILLRLVGPWTGFLHPTDISDNFEDITFSHPINSLLTATVLHVDISRRQATLSTRFSRMVSGAIDDKVVDAELADSHSLTIGQTTRGIVKSITEHGVFVTIGRNLDARVQIKELFDEYIKDWQSQFKLNQVICGTILSLDHTTPRIEMTLRSNSRRLLEVGALTDVRVGQKVRGHIKRVESYGLFIYINNSTLCGLCHKSEISDNNEADSSLLLASFKEGDAILAVVTGVDLERKRISLGIKPSYFLADDMAIISHSVVVPESHEGTPADLEDLPVEVAAEGSTQTAALDIMKDVASRSPRIALSHGLSSDVGFQWPVRSTEFEDDSDQMDKNLLGKTTPQIEQSRHKLLQDETGRMHSSSPHSADDFERLLLTSPNSSYLWIRYISFHLQLSDLDVARQIGKRALSAIHYREIQEKFNIWVCMLNMEVTYGEEGALKVVFAQAIKANDSKAIHLRLAAIYSDTGSRSKAEELYEKTIRKFGSSCKVWVQFGEFYYNNQQPAEAKKLLLRGLRATHKHKHVKLVSKFAQLEFRTGEPERGRTLFEGLLSSHPKRLDLWSVYVDMEVKQNSMTRARELFERLLAHKISAFKAKSVFKKWLSLEQRYGDISTIEHVKSEAKRWNNQYNSNDS